MKKWLLSLALSLVTLGFAATAWAQVEVDVRTDKETYAPGDELSMTIDVGNQGSAVSADVHIAIIAPGEGIGTIYEWPDWNTDLRPVFSDAIFPAGFEVTELELFSVPVDASSPPFQAGSGTYVIIAAFMEPGTLRSVGDLGWTSFSVKAGPSEQDSVGGIFFSRSQDFRSGGGVDVFASAAFLNTLEQRTQFNVEVPSLELDTCETFSWTIDSSGFNTELPAFLDAGPQIEMNGSPNGSILLNKLDDVLVYGPSNELAQSDYQGGKEYTFASSGGPDVGGFSVSVEAPKAVELKRPDPAAPLTIDRDQDLRLQWIPSNAEEEIWVTISTTNISFDPKNPSSLKTTIHECQCRFRDDGSEAILSRHLKELPDDEGFGFQVPGGDTGLPGSTLDVFRAKWERFNAPGLNYGVGVITSGITKDVNFK